MQTEISLFQLSDNRSIIFRYSTFEGMVGETYYVNSYDIINNHTLELVGKGSANKSATVIYNLLKELYKRVEGKARRIEFHSHMKNFNPKHIEHLAECSTADAISRVI